MLTKVYLFGFGVIVGWTLFAVIQVFDMRDQPVTPGRNCMTERKDRELSAFVSDDDGKWKTDEERREIRKQALQDYEDCLDAIKNGE